MNEWRIRFREALDRTWKKRAAVAWDASVAPETLSRIVTGHSARPGFDVVVRLTHAAGETVGWLLGERGYSLSAEQVKHLREAAAILREVTRDET
jgi:hypothetical protein